MSIIKKFSAVVLALAVSTASADLIYWQINEATGNQYAGENFKLGKKQRSPAWSMPF